MTKSSEDVVVSKPGILSEVENLYGKLYASHESQPDPENEDARATLTRHLTEDQPEVGQDEIEATLKQLKNRKFLFRNLHFIL